MLLYKSRVQFTGGTGGNGVSTMYFSTLGGHTAQDASDAHGDFFARIKGVINDAIRITIDPEVTTIESLTGVTTAAYSVTNRTFLGEDGGDMLPWQTQGLVKFQTGTFVAGRRLTGRCFVPGPSEGSNTDGVPTAGYLATLDGSAVLLAESLGVALMVYSPTHHTHAITNGVSLPARWASLRSRRD
jgi:hypothetical protein